ncbi:hypothetical protein [Aureimonas ureilytica]|uniref:hypothetical protein n=1 Tax=Aureimonas ureilytica TaxID=401562 RepID=UPI00035FA595|nr:hypothetical protein [Aureimonas ureilytica]
MADTDWTNEELASLDRIPRYNILDPANGGDAYSFGGDGYLDNQMRQTVDALIVARGARRMALSASSAAILAAQEAASAKAERMAAQNAATNAYNSAQDSAAKVALAAAEVDKAKAEVVNAKAEVGRAKVEADRAGAYASGLNLPAVTAEMAGRFLRVNAAGTAYELGLITVATAAEINSGTGLGFANAQTLGPILQGIKDTTTAAAGKVSPIGSYILWPQYAKTSPGENWVEAKGQIVSLASYPDLPNVLPAYPKGFGTAFPEGQSSQIGSGNNSANVGLVVDGDRWVNLIYGSVTAQDIGSPAFYGSANINARSMTEGMGILRPIMRNKEVIYFQSSKDFITHLDTTSAATINAGEKTSNIISLEPNAAKRTGGGFYKLANGTILAIVSVSASYGYKRVFRLRPTSAFNQWEAFDTPNTGGLNNPSSADIMLSWQIKSGAVFIAARLNGSTGGIGILRTIDGLSWSPLGSFNFHSGAGGGATDVVVNQERLWRQGQGRRPVNVIEESADGRYIVLSLYYGFLVSRDFGASWSYVTAPNLLGYGTTYYGAGGNDNDVSHVAFRWSKLKNCFYFVSVVDRRANGNQGATQAKYMAVWTTTDLTTFTKVSENPIGLSTNFALETAACAITNSIVYFLFKISATGTFAVTLNTTTGEFKSQNDLSSYKVNAYLEGISDDFVVMEIVNSGNSFGILWIPTDDTLPAATINVNHTSYGFHDFGATATGSHCGASSYYSGQGLYYTYFAATWAYNPVTERRMPNVNAGAISETMRSTAMPPRVYMRAK